MTPETCPNCGADVPRGAKSCPECGSDEQTGWSEEASGPDLGAPDDNFNYDEYVKREFEGSPAPGRIHWLWALVAFLLAAAALVAWFR